MAANEGDVARSGITAGSICNMGGLFDDIWGLAIVWYDRIGDPGELENILYECIVVEGNNRCLWIVFVGPEYLRKHLIHEMVEAVAPFLDEDCGRFYIGLGCLRSDNWFEAGDSYVFQLGEGYPLFRIDAEWLLLISGGGCLREGRG